jgi:outer membrane protein W
MKKSILTCAVFLLVCGAQAVHAETDRDWAVSGYVGIVDYETEEKPDPFQAIMHEMSSDNAYKFGVIASKYYKDFSFNIGIEFTQEVDTFADEKHIGNHSHVPVFLGVNYHYDTSFIDPYIGVGFGYSFNDASVSDFIADQGITSEVDDSTFYFLTAGVDYPLSERYSLFLSGQYSIGDIDVSGTVQTPQGTMQMEDEGTLDRYEFNLGIRYFF